MGQTSLGKGKMEDENTEMATVIVLDEVSRETENKKTAQDGSQYTEDTHSTTRIVSEDENVHTQNVRMGPPAAASTTPALKQSSVLEWEGHNQKEESRSSQNLHQASVVPVQTQKAEETGKESTPLRLGDEWQELAKLWVESKNGDVRRQIRWDYIESNASPELKRMIDSNCHKPNFRVRPEETLNSRLRPIYEKLKTNMFENQGNGQPKSETPKLNPPGQLKHMLMRSSYQKSLSQPHYPMPPASGVSVQGQMPGPMPAPAPEQVLVQAPAPGPVVPGQMRVPIPGTTVQGQVVRDVSGPGAIVPGPMPAPVPVRGPIQQHASAPWPGQMHVPAPVQGMSLPVQKPPLPSGLISVPAPGSSLPRNLPQHSPGQGSTAAGPIPGPLPASGALRPQISGNISQHAPAPGTTVVPLQMPAYGATLRPQLPQHAPGQRSTLRQVSAPVPAPGATLMGNMPQQPPAQGSTLQRQTHLSVPARGASVPSQSPQDAPAPGATWPLQNITGGIQTVDWSRVGPGERQQRDHKTGSLPPTVDLTGDDTDADIFVPRKRRLFRVPQWSYGGDNEKNPGLTAYALALDSESLEVGPVGTLLSQSQESSREDNPDPSPTLTSLRTNGERKPPAQSRKGAPRPPKSDAPRLPEPHKRDAPTLPEPHKRDAPTLPEPHKRDAPTLPEPPKRDAPTLTEPPKSDAPTLTEPPKSDAPTLTEPPKSDAPTLTDPPKSDAPTLTDPPKSDAPTLTESPKSDAPTLTDSPKSDAPRYLLSGTTKNTSTGVFGGVLGMQKLKENIIFLAEDKILDNDHGLTESSAAAQLSDEVKEFALLWVESKNNHRAPSNWSFIERHASPNLMKLIERNKRKKTFLRSPGDILVEGSKIPAYRAYKRALLWKKFPPQPKRKKPVPANGFTNEMKELARLLLESEAQFGQENWNYVAGQASRQLYLKIERARKRTAEFSADPMKLVVPVPETRQALVDYKSELRRKMGLLVANSQATVSEGREAAVQKPSELQDEDCIVIDGHESTTGQKNPISEDVSNSTQDLVATEVDAITVKGERCPPPPEAADKKEPSPTVWRKHGSRVEEVVQMDVTKIMTNQSSLETSSGRKRKKNGVTVDRELKRQPGSGVNSQPTGNHSVAPAPEKHSEDGVPVDPKLQPSGDSVAKKFEVFSYKLREKEVVSRGRRIDAFVQQERQKWISQPHPLSTNKRMKFARGRLTSLEKFMTNEAKLMDSSQRECMLELHEGIFHIPEGKELYNRVEARLLEYNISRSENWEDFCTRLRNTWERFIKEPLNEPEVAKLTRMMNIRWKLFSHGERGHVDLFLFECQNDVAMYAD